MQSREEKNEVARNNRAARHHNQYEGMRSRIINIYLNVNPNRGAWNHEKILASMGEVWTDCKDYPLWMRYRLEGVRDTMLDVIWRTILVNTAMLDGKRILTADIPSGRWSDVKDSCMGVFLAEGTFVPF